jgi:hypothetical protein
MLESPAYQVLSGGAAKVIARIAIEHMAHGGGSNGALPVTHNDFANYGIRRRSILPFLSEAIALGFVDRTQKGVRCWGELEGAPALYKLSWLPTHDGQSATNEWERFTTVEEAEQAVAAARAAIVDKRTREKLAKPRRWTGPGVKPRYALAAE